MHVVFIVRDLGLGGVAHCVALVAHGLANRGITVEILVLESHTNRWTQLLSHVKVTDLTEVWRAKKPWTWFAAWYAVRKKIKCADVVIAATFLMPLYMAWAATRGLSNRLVTWVHGPMAELDAFARMNPVHRFACKRLYLRLPNIICVSDHTRRSLARWLNTSVRPSWVVLPNFAEPSEPCPSHTSSKISKQHKEADDTCQVLRDESHVPSLPLQLLFVGRIAEEKQPHLWLDTIDSLRLRGIPAYLTVLGEGPLEGWLEKEATRRGLAAQLNLIGPIENVNSFMRQADWLLLTSQFEGFGLVVLEAMQIGLPVVSTDSGGVCELFDGRIDDFITPVQSGAALADKIITQWAQYQEISTWARHRAQTYAPTPCLDRWVAYLDPSRQNMSLSEKPLYH